MNRGRNFHALLNISSLYYDFQVAVIEPARIIAFMRVCSQFLHLSHICRSQFWWNGVNQNLTTEFESWIQILGRWGPSIPSIPRCLENFSEMSHTENIYLSLARSFLLFYVMTAKLWLLPDEIQSDCPDCALGLNRSCGRRLRATVTTLFIDCKGFLFWEAKL